MDFNLYNTLILVGTLQGFIFVGVVFFSKKFRSQSNFYLALLILAVSLNNLQYYLRDSNVISFRELMDIYYIPFANLNAAFLYAYFVTLLQPEIKKMRRIKWFFLPFVFFLIVTTAFKIAILTSSNPENLIAIYNAVANFHEFFAALFSFSVLIAGRLMIRTYERTHDAFDFKIVRHQLTWLKITIALLFVIVVLYVYLMVRTIFNPDVEVSFYTLWIGNSFMIYWLGHIGIYKYGIYKERKKIRKFSNESRPKLVLQKQKNENILALEGLMLTKKRFLDSEINLETIASELNVSSGHLSRVVNSELHMSFSDYVNSLRVSKAKSYLSNPEFENYTLAAIGMEAGFNSRSTFYASFKKITSLTPSQYKEQIVNS